MPTKKKPKRRAATAEPRAAKPRAAKPRAAKPRAAKPRAAKPASRRARPAYLEPGAYVHVELYSDAPEATRRFYTEVFGWTFEATSYGPGLLYTTYRTPGGLGGGLMPRTPGPLQPPGTLAYLLTDDLAKTNERIAAAGGRVLEPRIEVPKVGRFAVFQAPGGIVQAVWEPHPQFRPR